MTDIALEIARDLEICGNVEVEFMWDAGCGKAYVIEVNPRISGVTVLTNIHSGINVEKEFVNMLTGNFKLMNNKILNKVTLEVPFNKLLSNLDKDCLKKLSTLKKTTVRKRTNTAGALVLSGLVQDVIYDLKHCKIIDEVIFNDILEKLEVF